MTLLNTLTKRARAWLPRTMGPNRSEKGVSTDYASLDTSGACQIKEEWVDAWKDASIPARQRTIVEPQLRSYRAGETNDIFDALVEVLKHNVTNLDSCSLIEIGCSSGYYSEVLAARGVGAAYQGCDYSEAFIKMARRLYPMLRFDVEDATTLSYGNAVFDIVVSGGCILHIPNYVRAVAEAARISRQWVAFHRTPVLHMRETAVYTKKAYGVETVEIHFSEQALVRLLNQQGLRIIDTNTHSISWDSRVGDALAWKTYLCEKA